jgi:colanic acid biosynthesis glycosyl transferase WcaI
MYGINYSPELTGIGKYTGEMAHWLSSKNKVKVITAPPYYPEWKIPTDYSGKRYTRYRENNIEVIRCPLYVPSNPNSLKRILHLLSFSISSSLPVLLSYFWRPNIIFIVVPTFFCSIHALFLGLLGKNKTVIHIQDFEIDAMFGLSMFKGGLIKKIVFYIELKILNSFDYVSTISEGMMNLAIKKGVNPEKLIFLPNWSELDNFLNISVDEKLEKKIKEIHDDKIILYSGNMGEKQGLEFVIKAAKKMENYSEFHFLMVGDGAAKSRLINLAESLNLKNITFLDLVSYKALPTLLNAASCHLITQKIAASDLVMPSKLINIFAVGGNAVIAAEKDTTLGSICTNNPNIATLVKPESEDALIHGIKEACKKLKPNSIAQNYAKNYFDKELILNKFMDHLK